MKDELVDEAVAAIRRVGGGPLVDGVLPLDPEQPVVEELIEEELALIRSPTVDAIIRKETERHRPGVRRYRENPT